MLKYSRAETLYLPHHKRQFSEQILSHIVARGLRAPPNLTHLANERARRPRATMCVGFSSLS